MTWPTKTTFADGDVLTAAEVNNIGTNLNAFNPTSATNGQIWVADGAGSGAYASVSSGGYTLIQTSSLASLSTITVSSIPGTYRHLYFSLENMYAGSTGYFEMNLNSGGGYGVITMWQGPSNTTATLDAQFDNGNFSPTSANARAIGTSSSQPTRVTGFVYDYTTTNKQTPIRLQIGRYPAQSDSFGSWQTTTGAAVTSIVFRFNTTLTAGTLNLYGVK